MIAMFRKAEAQKDDRRFQILLHRDNSAYGAALADVRGLLPKGKSHRFCRRVDVGSFAWSEKGSQEGLWNDFHIGVALLYEFPNESKHLVGILIRYEPHAELGFGRRSDRSFHSAAGVPSNHSMDLEGRLGPQALHELAG